MAIEEIPYRVIEQHGDFELREYSPYIVAETLVSGDIEEAGNTAFPLLFGYISGKNSRRDKIAMTSPVTQQEQGQKISMTAPVQQQASGEQWVISFSMPAAYTLDSLPQPDNPVVQLREVPSRQLAAVRYSGRWTEKLYQRHLQRLQKWMQSRGMSPAGDAIWARYNPPFMPWFWRRNEILIPVDAAGADSKEDPAS